MKHDVYADPRGKLVLYVGTHRKDDDNVAEKELRAFDPHLEVIEIDDPKGSFTPRLDAIDADGSFYRGLAAIVGFVKQYYLLQKARMTS